ncbi:nicotinate-nucleotide pyrophosphorylase [carboxylating], chloroplastic [Tanacetum coccineum]|uniref:Nicotinate-nucleotide pyrophosphorylase [carboxylating], chloroplastic n=1 Tax=Tanacetum coccineum TaxID=301880 RepID=A0ABQ5FU04_9ASTR
MLDKDLYDSWKSRMELYMQNREHGRMILESVEHDPLIWPMIEENRMTRTKKYAEFSATKKIQVDCDMKATNIILQGLPADIYSLDDWILSYQMPRDLSCWTTVCEHSGDTFVSCIDIGEMEYYENDLKHPYLIDNEVSTLHRSPNNRLYMLPSTPQVLLESMGPYGSTRLNGVWKRMQPLDRSEIVLIGEGQNHRLGLFDTVMIKDNHTCVVGGVSNALKSVDLYLKNNNLQMGVKILYETKNHKQQVDNDIPFVSFGDFDSPSCFCSKVTYEDELPAAERYESDDSFGEPASSVVFCTKTKPNCNACQMRGQCRHFASALARTSMNLRMDGSCAGSFSHIWSMTVGAGEGKLTFLIKYYR